MLCGEPAAPSVNVSKALIAPGPVGLKVTETVQFAVDIKLVPHVVVLWNDAAPVPVMEIEEIVRGAVPGLTNEIF